jgi:NAD(P)-dependent dehydrogenase (short-subunit alcohol dehydrogenase family)
MVDELEVGERVSGKVRFALRVPDADAMAARLIDGAPEMGDMIAAMHPIGRTGKPEEIGDAVTWLLSDQASFVTGVSMPVDGGLTAQ